MAVPQDGHDSANDRGATGKQSQLSGLTGSAFAALDGEVQNGKEKGEGRALFAHTPLHRQAKLGGQAAGS